MKTENLNRCMDRLFDEKTLHNAAIRIGRNDDVIADVFRGGPVDETILFDMASVTKIVATTSLALIALDRRMLSLEDKISEFFPCPKEKQSLSVRNLLTHTVGIGHKNLCAEGVCYDNIAQHILNIPSDIPIGSDVRYSCPGFILLGKILEKIFGAPLEELFLTYVATPLNMKHSRFVPDRRNRFVNANPEITNRGMVNDYNCRFLGGISGNAGLFSNLTDMTCYVQCLLRKGAPLFSSDIFDLARENHTCGKSEARGLGFLYVDERYGQTGTLFPAGSIGHCGHTGQSVFVHPDSGLYVIILSDATVSTVHKYGKEDYNEVIRMRESLHNAIRKDLEF